MSKIPGQLEIFPKQQPKTSKEVKPRRVRGEILPGGLDKIDRIKHTTEPHLCARCEEAIKIGSGAQRVSPIEGGKLKVDKAQYFHLQSECPLYERAAGRPLTERP